jgi:hypothetical protein
MRKIFIFFFISVYYQQRTRISTEMTFFTVALADFILPLYYSSLCRYIHYLSRDNEVAVTAVLGDGREEEQITVMALCCEPYVQLFSRCKCSTILSL